jgi:hypothetical protein
MPPSPAQVSTFLSRLRRAVAEHRVEVRAYAKDGLFELGWTTADLRLELLELTTADLLRTEMSTAVEGDLIWVFTPDYWDGGHLWIRLVERNGIIVVSFHKG